MDHSTSSAGLSLKIPKVMSLTAGGGAWPFDQDFHSEWCWNVDLFSEAELDTIIALGEALEFNEARTGAGEDNRFRKSHVSWMWPNDHTSWIYDRLAMAVKVLNDQYFKFDLHGFYQGLQFTRYDSTGEHYEWHIDRGVSTAVRKLSVSLLLSDPDTYDGGDLQLKFGLDDQTIERRRGMLVMFPSWSLHRVTPVTRGVRHSLVAWVSGPAFK